MQTDVLMHAKFGRCLRANCVPWRVVVLGGKVLTTLPPTIPTDDVLTTSSSVNPLVIVYDIPVRKGEVLLFFPVPNGAR
jgi:hypothetical protein